MINSDINSNNDEIKAIWDRIVHANKLKSSLLSSLYCLVA